MKTTITALLILSMFRTSAQEIAGSVLDDKKEPLISAIIKVFQVGVLKGATVTDFDGNYLIKPLDPGNYNLLVLYTGFDSILVTNIVVIPGNRTTQNCLLSKASAVAKCTKMEYKKPLVERDRAEPILIKNEPSKIYCGWIDPASAIENTNHYTTERGAKVNLNACRGDIYIIDSVPVKAADTTGIDFLHCACANVEISSGTTFTLFTLTREQIDHMPATAIDDLVTIFPGIYQARRGDPISIRGNSGNAYYIDGVRQ
jgi:hypothetical protein